MRALSKTAETKLIGAIEKAAALVNNGADPNTAIIKSAAECDMPAGHINLMVHAYNTGRTNKQRENGDDPLEKAADFQLADVNTVMEALYPTQVKTSSELVRDTTVSTEYAVSPAGFLARRQAQMAKAAAALNPLPEKTYVPPPRDEHEEVRRQYSRQQAEKRAAEELRRQATAAYSKAAASMDAVVDYFRAPGNMPYGDAIREVELRFGQPGMSVLQKAAAVYPVIEKQAATKEMRLGHDRVYDLVNTALEDVHAYVDADNANPLKKAEAVCKKTAHKNLTGSVLQDPIDGPLELMKAAGPLSPHVSNFLGKHGPFPAQGPVPSVPATFDPPPLREDAYENRPDLAPGQQWEADVEKQIARGEESKDRLPQLEALRAAQQKLDEEEATRATEEAAAAKAETTAQRDSDAEEKARYVWHAGLDKQKQRADEKSKSDTAAEYEKGRKERADAAKNVPPPANAMSSAARSILNAGSRAYKTLPDYKGVSALGEFPSNVAAPVKFVGNAMGMSPKSILGLDKKPEDVERKSLKSLMAPEHETALRNIRAQGTLHDLVINDPVISGYDPQEVAMAFNDISEIAPSLVDNPGVLQAILRKRLESGQMADFDAKQLLEMDRLRSERDMIQAQTRKAQQEAL
jgi:hypothetical protein